MRYQARSVFFARFVFGTRVATFLVAGTFGVSALRFALAEATGGFDLRAGNGDLRLSLRRPRQEDRARRGKGRALAVLGGLTGLALYLALRAWATRAPPPRRRCRPRR